VVGRITRKPVSRSMNAAPVGSRRSMVMKASHCPDFRSVRPAEQEVKP
jgi:hypothetical protein